jgi:hypothetical protein
MMIMVASSSKGRRELVEPRAVVTSTWSIRTERNTSSALGIDHYKAWVKRLRRAKNNLLGRVLARTVFRWLWR